VKAERVEPGRPIDRRLSGAVLTRDVRVGRDAWSKGRVLSIADLGALEAGPVEARGLWVPEVADAGARGPSGITLLIPEAGDVHEDAAALELAAAVGGPGVTARGPAESRVDLLAVDDGVLRVDVPRLERLDRLDPVSVFSAYDGQVVARGAIVASVKVGPHLVPRLMLERATAIARARHGPVVDVHPFAWRRVAALVRETLAPAARVRFEGSVRTRVERLGSQLTEIAYAGEDADALAGELERLSRGPGAVAILLTAGAASTDPDDPVFIALERLGGRVVSHGVPAHPGSMLWLGRLRRTTIIGLPTCGAYSRATAVDLLLPWLLTGDPPTRATVARLGHGGLLTRDMRFRMPRYAHGLDAPDG
jgi:hypothetical protein